MMIYPLFRDRLEAGRILAKRLVSKILPGDLILALPRGGVPVGFEIAQKTEADLDIFLVRKLGVPGHEELAMGAIASNDVRVLNEELIRHLAISLEEIEEVSAREHLEIQRREELYRGGRPALPVQGRTVVLVDDGLATGATMLAASIAVREQQPKRVIVAVPVAAPEACERFRQYVDEVVCAEMPEPFLAVGSWYQDFSQTSDAEVQALLELASHKAVP